MTETEPGELAVSVHFPGELVVSVHFLRRKAKGNCESDPGKLGSLSVSSYSPYSVRAIHYVPLGPPPDGRGEGDSPAGVGGFKTLSQGEIAQANLCRTGPPTVGDRS